MDYLTKTGSQGRTSSEHDLLSRLLANLDDYPRYGTGESLGYFLSKAEQYMSF